MSTKRVYAVWFVAAVILLCTAAGATEDKLKKADEYLHAKAYGQAKELYREVFLSTNTGPLVEKSLFGIGKADFYLKHYDEAVLRFKRFETIYPDSAYNNENAFLLAYSLLYLNRLKEALPYFEKVKAPLKEKALIGQALIAFKTGDTEKTETLLKGVARELSATDPVALYLSAALLSKKGAHKEAVEGINKVSDVELKEYEFRVEKARILFEAKIYKDAEGLLKNVISNPASNSEVVYAKRLLINVFEAEGKEDDVLKLSKELLSYETKDDFKLAIIALYEKRGDVENTLRYLSYLRDKQRKAEEFEKRLKALLSGKDPKTLEYVTRFSGYLSPDSPFIIEAAHYLIEHNKLLEGILLFRKALKGKQRGEAALGLSAVFISQGKLQEPKKLLEPLVLDMRFIQRAAVLMGEIMEKEGNHAQAILYLEKVVRLVKENKEIAAKLGDLYWKSGDRKRALNYYVIASERGDGASAIKAGDCFYLSGEKAKALAYYKKALQANLPEGENLQWAYYQHGKLAHDNDSLKKASRSGGLVGEAASAFLKGDD